jgi:RND family efflux transporter MFP subunit
MPDDISHEAAAPHAQPSAMDGVRRIPAGRLRLAAMVGAGVAALIVVAGVATRVSADHGLRTWTRDQAIPTVKLATVDEGGVKAMVLPGDVQAFNNAAIHARTSGYLKRWYADIGTRVKAGQVLADIDTPDLDQQVMQARADLATAQANQRLADTTAKRWAGLLAQDAVSHQEADEKAGDLAAKSSAVNGAKANLDRLLALESFKRVVAPFDGVVTSRTTDIGALITSGSPSDQALFTLADERRLRVYVRVPQAYSALVRPGQTASLSVPEFPGETFQATVARDAQAVAGSSGTVLVELQLDNAQGRLKPGEYAQVSFALTSAAATTRVPATALQFRHEGPTVATVGPDGHIRLRLVTVSRDLGSSVEIGSGLQPGDRIVDNPPEALAEGDLVRVAGAAAPRSPAHGR